MRVLLHACCAPCGGYVIRELQTMGYEVTVFYFNPNIAPREEYELRLSEARRFCDKEGVKLIVPEYDHDDWLAHISGYEAEPEKGKRCELCYSLRLAETAQKASEDGYDAFATTLTISPHKRADWITAIGHEMAELYGVKFVDRVWREEDGFRKSCQLASEEHFHRQNYCGCEFSIRPAKN